MPSIGPVRIPIISSFDASGVAQAKAALQGMGGTGGGAGGGGAGGTAAGVPGPTAASVPGWQAGKAALGHIAGTVGGIPGMELAGIIGSLTLGPLAAGTAIFALSQRVADNAIRTRESARTPWRFHAILRRAGFSRPRRRYGDGHGHRVAFRPA